MKYNKIIFVELSNRCNMDCAYCPYHLDTRPRQDMSLSMVQKIADDLTEVDFVIAMMVSPLGEALLHPQIEECCNTLKSDRYPLTLVTNGVALKPEHAGLNLDALRISVETLTEAGFALRRTSAVFEDWLQNICDFVVAWPAVYDLGLTLMVRSPLQVFGPEYDCLLGPDVGSAVTVNAFLARIGSSVMVTPGQIHDNFSVVVLPRIKLIFRQMCYTNFTVEEPGVVVTPSTEVPLECRCHRSHVNIAVDGRATACCCSMNGQLYVGDIQTQSVQQILDYKENMYLDLSGEWLCSRCKGTFRRIE